MNNDLQSRLHQNWTRTFQKLSVPVDDAAFWSIIGKYTETHRHYHGVQHVEHVLVEAKGLFQGDLPAPLTLGIFLHDVVYDIPGSNNEERSAAYAWGVLPSSLPTYILREVEQLVLSTRFVNYINEPLSYNEAVMRDADLGGLSCLWEFYSTNSAKLRKEWADLSDADWAEGRKAFLRSMLDLPRIFWTPANAPDDQWARENMERELASL